MKNLVLVTGANGEIGRSVCRELSNNGFSVLAVTRKAHPDLFESHKNRESIANVIVENLSDSSALDSILCEIDPLTLNSLNLVYAAAVFERIPDFREVTPEVWDRTLSVNLRDAFLWNQKISNFAIANRIQSSIVNIASQAWMTGGYGEVIAYAASKGGLVSMTKGLARVVAPHGVRVNCVAPGFIETKAMRGNLDENSMSGFMSQVPMMRLGKLDEVAHAIDFLLSEKSSYITGVTLAVSGGQLMH